MRTLQKIEMFQNGIRLDGMKALFDSFNVNPDLTVVKINDNLIKSVAETLIEIIPSLPNLREIDISDSLLGSSYSLKIFKELLKLKDIQAIYCNYNEIEDVSIQKEILELCSTSLTLKTLEIKGNEIPKKLWITFKQRIKNIENVHIFSDDEEDEEDEKDEEDEIDEEKEIEEKLDKIDLNK